ncbi:MAG: hypothetical protein QOE14_573, partial [Humisphaera sp.]|nr:hypothetical protein [Humisphaera sp.]
MKYREEKHHPSRRRLKILAALLTLVLVLLVGEFLASRAIADKLRTTVDSKLDAQLELGPLIYIPPYGAWAWNARITRDGEELFSVARVKLSLAQFPFRDKPIIISKLTVEQPVLSLAPGRFDKIAKPTGDVKRPNKLSDVLRLKQVRVANGQIIYVDVNRPNAPPTVWNNLTLDVDTIQQTVSKYTFHLVSRAGPLAEITAAGTMDVDELLLDVQSSTMKLRVEPEPSRSPLPAAAQEFIRQRRINGAVSISGSGKFPLRDPRESNFTAAIALENATAALPPNDVMLDHARASLVARMAPGGPMRVQIDRLDVAGGGKQAIVHTGQFELNAAARTWSVAEVDGQVIFTLPTTTVALLAPPRPPPVIAASLDGAREPQTQPAPDEPRGVDKLQIAGKGSFTAAASGPLELLGRNPWEAIRHQIIIYPRDASFRPKDFAHRIEGVGGGEIRLQDGMVIFQELQGHYGDDLLRLSSARLPVEGLPKMSRWQEISGTVVFHRPLQSYTPKLDKVFDALNPQGSFLIAGSYTVDKHILNAEGKGKNTFDLIVSTDVGSFALTERQIVLEKMRGDATVTNAGVDLHELEAEVLDGRVQATGRWARVDPQHATYEGEAVIRNVDLALLEDRLREEPSNKPLEGRIFGNASFRGAVTKGAEKKENLRTLRANGEIEIVRGSLFKVPVVRNITEQVKGLKGVAVVGDAAAVFE